MPRPAKGGLLPLRVALTAAALLPAACSDHPSSSTMPGAVQVRGSERLMWDQAGDVSTLRFRAYVDGVPTPLDAATCDATRPGPQGAPCTSPLPPLADGVHTIALSAVSLFSGLESERSAAITVQKISASASGYGTLESGEGPGVLRLSDGTTGTAARTLDDTVVTADGQVFDVRIVASGLEAPTQIALVEDGRLFVAERTGRVLVLEASARTAAGPRVAFDVRALAGAWPAGPPGLAIPADFARTGLVYVAYVARAADDQARLRIVRLREAGGTLGEPAVIVDQPLAGVPPDGPRLAFGADGLLHVALSEGMTLPADSQGGASGGALLRIHVEGDRAGRSGHPVFAYGAEQLVAFAWHPETGRPWAVLAGADGRATLRAIGAGAGFGVTGTRAPNAPLDAGGAFAPGGLQFRVDAAGGGEGHGPAAWIALPDNGSLWRVTPGAVAPPDILLPHALGRLGAIASGEGGEVLVATCNRDGRGHVVAEDDLLVRLTPR